MLKQVSIRGKKYALRPGIRASKTFEELTGIKFEQYDGSLSQLGEYLYSLINAHQRYAGESQLLTLDDVIDGFDIEEVQTLLQEDNQKGPEGN